MVEFKQFNSLKEIEKYYDKEDNTYVFEEDGEPIRLVKFNFDFLVRSNIEAYNINAGNIIAHNINANDINALNVVVDDINARDIDIISITALDINGYNHEIVKEIFGDAIFMLKILRLKTLKLTIYHTMHYALLIIILNAKLLQVEEININTLCWTES